MVAFTTFSDLLPDPNNKINNSGASDTAGSAGPGFAKIKFTSDNTTQVSRTISGRGITASPSYHKWAFDISYNPMTRSEFDPVGSFLESRRGRLNPFYVILPQHAKPQDSGLYTWNNPAGSNNPITANWASYATTAISGDGSTVTVSFATQTVAPFKIGDYVTVSGVTPTAYNGTYLVTVATTSSVKFASTTTTTVTVQGTIKLTATPAGSPSIMMEGFSASSGSPTPGDFFTITDTADSNHKKAYKVIRVEDYDTYQTGTIRPTQNTQRRVWTQPPLTRDVYPTAKINFVNPQFRVIQKGDTLEYDLDTDNLYQFALSLEEILP